MGKKRHKQRQYTVGKMKNSNNLDSPLTIAMHLVKSMTAEAQAQTRVISVKINIVQRNKKKNSQKFI